ncbi:MAG TPA: carbohydrate porin [Fimbriiglobus sp.]
MAIRFHRARWAAIAATVCGYSSYGYGQEPAPIVSLTAEPPAAAANPPAATAVAPTPAAPCPECAAPACPSLPSYAGTLCDRPVLFGDLGGARSKLRDCGITFNVYTTQFGQAVTSGGLAHQAEYGGRVDYLLHLDGQKVGLWEGLFVDLHGETIYGRSANGLTGALFPISVGQTVPQPDGYVTALTGVKVTQALSENFALFAGKINTADSYNQPFTGGAMGLNGFMNMAMVLPPTLARTVPYSTFGGGFVVLKDKEPIISAMVLDPNNTPTVSGFDTFFDRGVTIFGQLNVPTQFFGLKGHQGVLGSYSNSKYLALDDLPFFLVQQFRGAAPVLPTETGSWSVTYLFDQTLGNFGCDSTLPWGVFGNASITDGDANPIHWFANFGVGGASPLARRPHDTFGLGYFYAGMSDSFKSLAPRFVPLRDEQGVEYFYNMAITPWCHLTSDFQVVTPVRGNVTASVASGVRLRIDF